MKTLIVNDKPTIARLAERLKRAGSHAEYQAHSVRTHQGDAG